MAIVYSSSPKGNIIWVRAGRMKHLALASDPQRHCLCGSYKMYGGHQGPCQDEDMDRHSCKKCLAKAKKWLGHE